MKKLCMSLAVVGMVMTTSGFINEANAISPVSAPAEQGTTLGFTRVNPYGTAPLTAVIDLGGNTIKDVKVKVHGKGKNGVPVEYNVGKSSLLDHNGIAIFGLYANYRNKVTVSFVNLKDNKKYTHDYNILTTSLNNKYIDTRNITTLPEIRINKVDKKFKNELFMANSEDATAHGVKVQWATPFPKDAKRTHDKVPPSGGALNFDVPVFVYMVDTQGEFRWWLDPNAIYDSDDMTPSKMGRVVMSNQTAKGTFTYLRGQAFGEMDMLGKVMYEHELPRGFIDASHGAKETNKGTVIVRAAKANYKRDDGTIVHTVRDHILEIAKDGKAVDVWDLTKILDPYRDVLMLGMDNGAVCMNVDIASAGHAVKIEPDADFGDLPGVGAGRNWANTNSVEYDASDDSIILSLRHQGVVKIGRDHKVKWILAPKAGWKPELAKKLLQPINAKGKKISCDETGRCDDPNFEFTFTQHAAWLSPKGTLTVFDNGDARYFEQPAMAEDKFSRFVEYKIDEKNMTVKQVWQYGKDRGYDFYAPITSNVKRIIDKKKNRDVMYGFNASLGLFNKGERTKGKHTVVDYKTKKVLVDIDVLNMKPNTPHYRGVLVNTKTLFSK